MNPEVKTDEQRAEEFLNSKGIQGSYNRQVRSGAYLAGLAEGRKLEREEQHVMREEARRRAKEKMAAMCREELTKLREANAALRGALKLVEPIVTDAFYDHYSAGNLPGSGYSHKVYRRVSEVFGWRDTKRFAEWRKALEEAKDG